MTTPIRIASAAAALTIAGVALAPFAGAASGNGVTTPYAACTAGVCSAGAAGTYAASAVGQIVTLGAITPNAGWTCRVFVASGTQTRIECLSGSNKVIAQAEVKGGALSSKVVTRTR